MDNNHFFTILYLSLCSNFVFSLYRLKRTTETGLPRSGTKLSCDKGKMSIECNPGSSVYVTSAYFGSLESVNVCVRGGNSRLQINCSSPNTLNYVRSSCLGRTRCEIGVDEKAFGFSVTSQGNRCPDSWKHLKLNYDCVSDCRPPRFEGGVSVIGNQFSLNSKLKIKCRSGYKPLSDGSPVNQITCSLNGLWTGGSIICKDINECANEESNACDWHADCLNTIGGYTCKCGDGYYGDGFTCNAADVDRSWMDPIKNKSYDINTDSNCGGKLFQTSGVLESPNYPSLYPNSANCEWVISVPPSKIIEIEFMEFQLEGPIQKKGCTRDYVTVYNGPLPRPKRWLATYCGDTKPQNVRSTLNQIRIEFKTDPEASYSGFRMLFRTFNPLAVCRNFVTSSNPGVKIIRGVSNATVSAGDQVVLGCEAGFNISKEANVVRVCQNDMTWNDASNPCKALRCGVPRQFKEKGLELNGSESDYEYMGRPLMYSCKRGSFLIANPGVKKIIFCNQQGRWSNDKDEELPSCQKIQCDITDEMIPPQHADWILYNEQGELSQARLGLKVPYKSFVQYNCIKGYTLVGDSSRTCEGASNRWSGKTMICEEDNGVPGLNNFQLAIITSCASGAVILIVGGLLLYCCIAEKKKKQHNIEKSKLNSGKTGGSSYRPMHSSNYPTTNSGFVWSSSPGTVNQPVPVSFLKQNTSDVSQKPQIKRSYMLPSVVTPITPIWSDQPHASYGTSSSENAHKQSSSNVKVYSAVPRPTNRPKDSYAQYQKKFNKSR